MASFKTLIIGDQFVSVELLQQTLASHLQPLQLDQLSFETLSTQWPTTTFTSNDEILEFVGDPSEVAALAHDVQAIVTHLGPVTQAVIDAAPKLQIIGCCRGGPVNINVEAATQRNIPVINAPARNGQAVVEYMIGFLISVCRGIAPAHHDFANGIWRGDLYQYKNTGRELFEQTIGLVGLGAVARGLLPHLRLFNMRIMAYDPYLPTEAFAELGVEPVDFTTLLRESDIVSLHVRATPETVGMMGAAEFAQMKENAYFINTARGSLVNEDALYEALKSGHLAGAGLDTFVTEPPPPEWPLRALPNVTLTPHIGGASQNSAERGAAMIAVDVANLLAEKPFVNCVNL